MSIRASITAGLGLLALVAGEAQAQSAAYPTRHWDTTAGATSVALDGAIFVNHGLVGVAHLSAATRDFQDETLGSFSGMALDASTWRRLADGSYEGVVSTLPDRGPNNVGPFTGTSDYANRVHTNRFTLTPATGKATLTPVGGFLLRDATGQTFTGMDPGKGQLVRGAITYPSPTAGPGAGHISLDSEAIARLPDGGFYIGDEYGPGLYLFDRAGRQIGAIPPVPALAPMKDGKLDLSAEKPPATGRRNNQGLESVSVSPDGTRLFAILQSATVQDSGAGAQTRNNTRLLVYDISKTHTPAKPIGHYVLQLPALRESGDGGAPDVTAAQSEMLALNDSQVLVLARDGNGRGKGTPLAPAYKAVLLVDLKGATNLAGTPYEQDVLPVAKDGVLKADITPVKQVELINLLNPVQLAKFGMNLSVTPSTPMSLPEKIEAMSLAPALDPKAPHDVFLLIGDDNDFETAKGRVAGQDFDASLTNIKGSGVGDNDNLILVYRLTLPTYRPSRR
jgi:hypothetical protein